MPRSFWLVTEENKNWRKDKTLSTLKKVNGDQVKYFDTPTEALKSFNDWAESNSYDVDITHTSEGSSCIYINESYETMTSNNYYFQHITITTNNNNKLRAIIALDPILLKNEV